ncbi:sensor histidine kinase [Nocardia takedensis]|uniref:sensor histidine kinase n=1 Tax=Nocardia takedensis TaxID=259390 RepID=UPI003F767E04
MANLGSLRKAPSRADTAIAVTVSAADVALFSDLLRPLPSGLHTGAPVVLFWAVLGGVLLMWRRFRPVSVAVLLCVHSATASTLLSYRPILPLCVAVGTVAALCARRAVLAGIACAAVAVPLWVSGEVRTSPLPVEPAQQLVVGSVYAVLLLGAVGIGRRQRHTAQRRREMARRNRETARRGAERAHLAVLAERRRMARELHDIIGSTVTVMMLQAAGARRVMTTDPPRADNALAAVDELGAQALGELHRLLGLLRATDDVIGDSVAELSGLAQLTGLLSALRSAGMRIDLAETGTRAHLDPSVDLTCFRVIQEALTNVARHVGPQADPTVTLAWTPSLLTITVEDDGTTEPPARTHAGGGKGLIGLAERVAIAGGTFDAGPRPRGGFRLEARLPCAVTRPR